MITAVNNLRKEIHSLIDEIHGLRKSCEEGFEQCQSCSGSVTREDLHRLTQQITMNQAELAAKLDAIAVRDQGIVTAIAELKTALSDLPVSDAVVAAVEKLDSATAALEVATTVPAVEPPPAVEPVPASEPPPAVETPPAG